MKTTDNTEKNAIVDGLLKIQNKETWIEDINDIIYGYSRAIMLYAASDNGSDITNEPEHLYMLKLIQDALKDKDRFYDTLFCVYEIDDYTHLFSSIVGNYSIAVINAIRTDPTTYYERTEPHLLILKDLYTTFHKYTSKY